MARAPYRIVEILDESGDDPRRIDCGGAWTLWDAIERALEHAGYTHETAEGSPLYVELEGVSVARVYSGYEREGLREYGPYAEMIEDATPPAARRTWRDRIRKETAPGALE